MTLSLTALTGIPLSSVIDKSSLKGKRFYSLNKGLISLKKHWDNREPFGPVIHLWERQQYHPQFISLPKMLIPFLNM